MVLWKITVPVFQNELFFKFFTIALVKNGWPQRSFKKNWQTCNTFVVILNKMCSVSLVKILIFFSEVKKYQFLAETLDFQIGPILNKVLFLNQIRSGLLICSLSQCVNKFSYLISSNLPTYSNIAYSKALTLQNSVWMCFLYIKESLLFWLKP